VTVTLTANEVVFVSAEAILGSDVAGAYFYFCIGYQLGAGAVTPATSILLETQGAANSNQDCADSYIFAVPSSGTYNFGLAVADVGPAPLDNNFETHVSVIVLS